MEDTEKFDSIPVVDTPAIRGLRFRRFRGEVDHAALVAVRTGCVEWDGVSLRSHLEGVPTLTTICNYLPDEDPANNLLIAEIDGAVIAYHAIEWWTEKDGTWLYLNLGWVLPQWRGQGIGSAMLHWAEARIRRLAAAHPTNGKGMFGANATTSEREATALLRDEGYTPTFRLLEMVRRMPGPAPIAALPHGLEVRPVRRGDYRAIWMASSKAYDQTFSEAPTEERYQRNLADFLKVPEADLALWQVAWDGDHVAGQVTATVHTDGPVAGLGEILNVAVGKPWRRQGLARALLVRALNALGEQGIDDVRLHTVAEFETRARDLYESAGFQLSKEHVRYRKPIEG